MPNNSEWTNERLLLLALTMLLEARAEQMLSRRKNKWLGNNRMMDVICERVASFAITEEGSV